MSFLPEWGDEVKTTERPWYYSDVVIIAVFSFGSFFSILALGIALKYGFITFVVPP